MAPSETSSVPTVASMAATTIFKSLTITFQSLTTGPVKGVSGGVWDVKDL